MTDSVSSSGSGEPRMLERRVSNQRAELTNDQQMNYLLAWFNNWSDLQKEDFIPVLAEKLSSKWAAVNGVSDSLNSLTLDNNRPPSLFQCQVLQSSSSNHISFSLVYVNCMILTQ